MDSTCLKSLEKPLGNSCYGLFVCLFPEPFFCFLVIDEHKQWHVCFFGNLFVCFLKYVIQCLIKKFLKKVYQRKVPSGTFVSDKKALKMFCLFFIRMLMTFNKISHHRDDFVYSS